MNPNRKDDDLRHIGDWVNDNTKRDPKGGITSPANPRSPEVLQQSPSSNKRSYMMDRYMKEGPKDTPWSSAKMGNKK